VPFVVKLFSKFTKENIYRCYPYDRTDIYSKFAGMVDSIIFLVESEFHHPINWWNWKFILFLVESEFHRPFNWWNWNSTIP